MAVSDEDYKRVTRNGGMSDEARARVRATAAAPVWPTALAAGDEPS
jgi:hypothetical protein